MQDETLQQYKKSVPKKTVMKLKPGTWVVIKWTGSPNEIGLLLAKPEYEPGDVSLELLFPHRPNCQSRAWAVHSQVVAVMGMVEIPRLTTS